MEDYLSNIQARDVREKIHDSIIGQYGTIAARATGAEAKLRALESSETPIGESAPSQLLQHLRAELSAARTDLSTTQTNYAASISRISALEDELKNVTKDLSLAQQQRENVIKQASLLDRKLKDRHSESRESRKFVDDVQNEMITLNLQLSMAEQKAERLEKDNKELVERWMALKSEQAERMNVESRW